MQGRVLIALVPASFVSWSGSGIVYVEYMQALSQANYKTDTSCLQTVFAAQDKSYWGFFASATGVCAEMSTRSEGLFYLQIASDTAKALLP